MAAEPQKVASRFGPWRGFALAGAFGFVIDASILTALVLAGWDHYSARAVSFATAVTCTWYVNRRWVFRTGGDPRGEYGRYFVVQLIGAALNLAAYVAIIESVPPLARYPVVPLAAGAVLGFLFNYFASRSVVFAAPRAGRAPSRDERPTGEGAYSGAENLDAMKHAKNYNGYLVELVDRHVRGQVVLDFGAGAGTFAVPLSRPDRRILCVEPDESLRRELYSAGLEAVAGLRDVPERSVDSIYTLNVLEHIGDDVAALKELHRRLKPGGRLLVYVPAFEALFTSMDRKVGHFRRYRRSELEQRLEQAGFELELGRYVDSLGFFVTLLYKWIGSDSGVISARSVRLYDRCVFPLSRVVDVSTAGSFGKNLLAIARKS